MTIILKNKDYLRFWVSEIISAFGSRIQSSAIIWAVYMKTDSIVLLGLLAIIETLPALLFSFKAGSIVEKYKKSNIYWWCQIGNLITTILMFLVLFFSPQMLYIIILLLFIQNTIGVLSGPSKKVLIHSITDKEDISEAIRLEGLLSNLAKVFGPPVAGFALMIVSAEVCFLLNALTYLPFIILGARLNIKNDVIVPYKNKNSSKDLKDTFDYLKTNRPLTSVLVFLLISCMF